MENPGIAPDPLSIPPPSPRSTVALAGGVGGARLADGLAQALPAESLTVVVNIGDDFDYYGLRICPDLDTVCYTLASLANPATGWGLAGETWRLFEGIQRLGGLDWFHIGDLDLATHLERTRRLRQGELLSRICSDFCRSWGVRSQVLPVSDDRVPTIVDTDEGSLPFQEYFVHRKCEPRVKGFRFLDVEAARPAPGVLEAIERADWIVLCPSNPWVSIDPILAVPGIRKAILRRVEAKIPVLAVSPIIAGQTVKGPAAKMYAELGFEPSARSVACHYQPILTGFLIDHKDKGEAEAIQALGLQVRLTDALMKDRLDRARLAGELVDFWRNLKP